MATEIWHVGGRNSYEKLAYPALVLVKFYDGREGVEFWERRWSAAVDAVNGEGALDRLVRVGKHQEFGFAALPDSPVWRELGNGAGGFTDGLMRPYPPFVYGSGWKWTRMRRKVAVKYGLADTTERVPPGEGI